MDLGKDRIRTPWAWLRGFAWFLLAWPLFGLLALGEILEQGMDEWDVILGTMLVPPAIGAVLLLLERGLTRVFGTTAIVSGQAVPSLLRDVSNLGLAMAILMGINVVLVSAFEDENLFTRPDLNAGPIAAQLLAACFGTAVVFRLLHRLVHGPARHGDLGEGWDEAPTVLRFFGYLTLIPLLLVCTVMIDYTLRSKPDFGLVAWIALPALLWLGLRSAMARSPRYWARDPWEAWRRRTSLTLPWWLVGLVLGVGTCVLLVIAPWMMSDDEISFAGRIIVGVLLGPIGLLGVYAAIDLLRRELPLLVRRGRTTRILTRDPTALIGWELRHQPPAKGDGPGTTDVVLRLRDGREVPFAVEGEDAPLVRWLRAHA